MNITVDVEIGFSFKRELDDAYRSLELPEGATVLDSLSVLADGYPVFRKRVFDEAGEIRRNINALINGGNVQFRKGFNTVLNEGDRLSVLPPVGGGCALALNHLEVGNSAASSCLEFPGHARKHHVGFALQLSPGRWLKADLRTSPTSCQSCASTTSCWMTGTQSSTEFF